MSLSREILRDKFKGAVLGCFLGDAFGSGFEGMDPDRARFHIGNLSKTFTRSYTNDTDMTLALAESLIQCGKIDPEDIAKQFGLPFLSEAIPIRLRGRSEQSWAPMSEKRASRQNG